MIKQLKNTAAIVLAAGKGTRMNSVDANKVTVALNGQPMVTHTIDNLVSAGVDQIIVVVGFQADSVKSALGDKVEYVEQLEQLGTGHAVQTALPSIETEISTVLAVSGDDSSFYPPSLYQEMVTKQRDTQADVLVLTINKTDPTGLGRIIRDSSNNVVKIVEEKNATPEERLVTEINTGFYCFDREFVVSHIDKIEPNPVTGELYATDLVEIALGAGKKVETHLASDSSIWHGVNTQADYEQAKVKYQKENNE